MKVGSESVLGRVSKQRRREERPSAELGKASPFEADQRVGRVE